MTKESGTDHDVAARQLESGLWILDTRYQGVHGVIAAYMFEGAAGLTLIDVGSAATCGNLVAAIEQTGHQASQIQHIVVTHVHLDHAGACGSLMRVAPDARVYVHPAGAPHLSDPTRLLASAARVYGDRMEAMWGITLPVPADRIVTLDDGEQLIVSERVLTALHTPGHAIHHIAFYDAARQSTFAGDVAGVTLEGTDYVRPPTPPPDLDLEAWGKSIARLSRLPIQRLYLPHFGRVEHVDAHWRALEARLADWGEFVLAGMNAGKKTDQIADELARTCEPELLQAAQAARGHDGGMSRRYELATNYRMTVQGYERYWRTRHPDRLAATFL